MVPTYTFTGFWKIQGKEVACLTAELSQIKESQKGDIITYDEGQIPSTNPSFGTTDGIEVDVTKEAGKVSSGKDANHRRLIVFNGQKMAIMFAIKKAEGFGAWVVHELMHGAGKEHRDAKGEGGKALPEDENTIFYPNENPSEVVENRFKGNAGLTRELQKVFNIKGNPKDNRKENSVSPQANRKVR
ncbi:MAG: hypothetical protein RMJ53_10420 [Chitinophagales bacterium]|nr:hypothetical protein [Candidatus Calescibacterium sp.]MDW8274631.1 hypothetical protein [Chitinophagales bacterium]